MARSSYPIRLLWRLKEKSHKNIHSCEVLVKSIWYDYLLCPTFMSVLKYLSCLHTLCIIILGNICFWFPFSWNRLSFRISESLLDQDLHPSCPGFLNLGCTLESPGIFSFLMRMLEPQWNIWASWFRKAIQRILTSSWVLVQGFTLWVGESEVQWDNEVKSKLNEHRFLHFSSYF